MVAVKDRDFPEGEDKLLLAKFEILSNFDKDFLSKKGGYVLLGCRTEITQEVRVLTNEGLRTENEICQRNCIPKPLVDVSIFSAVRVLIDHNLHHYRVNKKNIHRIDLVIDSETFEIKTIARKVL